MGLIHQAEFYFIFISIVVAYLQSLITEREAWSDYEDMIIGWNKKKFLRLIPKYLVYINLISATMVVITMSTFYALEYLGTL